MLLLLWAGIICGSFVFKKSKLYANIIIVIGIILFTFSYDNADSMNYLISYNDLKLGRISVFSGNILSNILFYVAGFFDNYKIARFLFVSIAFLLIYNGVKRYTDNINTVLGFFLISPFVIDATQVKSIMSMSVLFYFSYYLFEAYRGHDRKKNTFLFLIGAFLATEFHFSYALTFLYLFILFWNKKKIVIAAIFVNVFGFSAFGITRINLIMGFITKYIPRFQSAFTRLRKVSFNITDEVHLYRLKTTFIFYVLLFISYAIVVSINKTLQFKEDSDSKNNISNEIGAFVLKMNIVTIFCLPLMAISMEIYRIQRDLLLMDYTYLATILITSDGHNSFLDLKLYFSNIKVLFIGLVLSIYYLYIEVIYGNINTVFLPLFHMTR